MWPFKKKDKRETLEQTEAASRADALRRQELERKRQEKQQKKESMEYKKLRLDLRKARAEDIQRKKDMVAAPAKGFGRAIKTLAGAIRERKRQKQQEVRFQPPPIQVAVQSKEKSSWLRVVVILVLIVAIVLVGYKTQVIARVFNSPYVQPILNPIRDSLGNMKKALVGSGDVLGILDVIRRGGVDPGFFNPNVVEPKQEKEKGLRIAKWQADVRSYQEGDLILVFGALEVKNLDTDAKAKLRCFVKDNKAETELIVGDNSGSEVEINLPKKVQKTFPVVCKIKGVNLKDETLSNKEATKKVVLEVIYNHKTSSLLRFYTAPGNLISRFPQNPEGLFEETGVKNELVANNLWSSDLRFRAIQVGGGPVSLVLEAQPQPFVPPEATSITVKLLNNKISFVGDLLRLNSLQLRGKGDDAKYFEFQVCSNGFDGGKLGSALDFTNACKSGASKEEIKRTGCLELNRDSIAYSCLIKITSPRQGEEERLSFLELAALADYAFREEKETSVTVRLKESATPINSTQ